MKPRLHRYLQAWGRMNHDQRIAAFVVAAWVLLFICAAVFS